MEEVRVTQLPAIPKTAQHILVSDMSGLVLPSRADLQSGPGQLHDTRKGKGPGGPGSAYHRQMEATAIIQCAGGSKQPGACNQSHLGETGNLLNVAFEFGAVFPPHPHQTRFGSGWPESVETTPTPTKRCFS